MSLRESFHVEAPLEMVLAKDVYLLPKRSWYVMRDAGRAFEFAVRDNLLKNEFPQGIVLAVCFPTWHLQAVVLCARR